MVSLLLIPPASLVSEKESKKAAAALAVVAPSPPHPHPPQPPPASRLHWGLVFYTRTARTGSQLLLVPKYKTPGKGSIFIPNPVSWWAHKLLPVKIAAQAETSPSAWMCVPSGAGPAVKPPMLLMSWEQSSLYGSQPSARDHQLNQKPGAFGCVHPALSITLPHSFPVRSPGLLLLHLPTGPH